MIYNQPPSMDLDQFLDLLTKFYESDVDREIEVFHVLVKGLLEQYNSCLPFKPVRE